MVFLTGVVVRQSCWVIVATLATTFLRLDCIHPDAKSASMSFDIFLVSHSILLWEAPALIRGSGYGSRTRREWRMKPLRFPDL